MFESMQTLKKYNNKKGKNSYIKDKEKKCNSV